jgi:hypothetical protein
MTVKLHATGIGDEMISILEAQGLPVRRELDIELPDFPTDITSVDDQQLMDLANRYMQNYNFMLTQVACADLAVIEADNAYDTAEAKAMLTKTTGKSTEKSVMLKASVLTDPDIVELSSNRLQAMAYHKILKTTLDNLERYYQLTSRELTRRTSIIKSRGF